MMWYLQPSVEALLFWLCSDQGTNFGFAILCLWAATGRQAHWCALVGAAIHVALAFM